MNMDHIQEGDKITQEDMNRYIFTLLKLKSYVKIPITKVSKRQN